MTHLGPAVVGVDGSRGSSAAIRFAAETEARRILTPDRIKAFLLGGARVPELPHVSELASLMVLGEAATFQK